MAETITPKVWSVSEFTRELRNQLEPAFASVCIEGEVSNYKKHVSGHHYFSLKDEDAVLSCSLFRNQARNLRFELENGMTVQAIGRISVYPPRGNYSLIAEFIQPVGVGALQLAFDQLKAKLEAEGILDRPRKPLPKFPRRVAIITSPTAAAFRDIVNISKKRAPFVPLTLFPALMQGDGSPHSVIQALKLVEAWGQADLVIIARGGGSSEDLWSFNDEALARQIAAARTPTVSAIGHEIDYTLSDYVADVRAPTPSGAAEIVFPDQFALSERLDTTLREVYVAMRTSLERQRQRLEQVHPRAWQRNLVNRLEDSKLKLSGMVDKLESTTREKMAGWRYSLERFRDPLVALNPLSTLERGYTLAERDGQIISHAAALNSGDTLTVRFADGTATSTVQSVNLEDAHERS